MIDFEFASGEVVDQIIKKNGFLAIIYECGDFTLFEYGSWPDGEAFLEQSSLEELPPAIEDLIHRWEEVK